MLVEDRVMRLVMHLVQLLPFFAGFKAFPDHIFHSDAPWVPRSDGRKEHRVHTLELTTFECLEEFDEFRFEDGELNSIYGYCIYNGAHGFQSMDNDRFIRKFPNMDLNVWRFLDL